MPLTVDIKWREQYASSALNRKLAGVLDPGIYWGFAVAPGGGLNVRVFEGADPDYPVSVAVVERDGYSMTVRLDTDETVPILAPGTWHIVLEGSYIVGQDTSAALKAVPSPAPHHVVLAKVVVPEGAAAITTGMISAVGRSEAHPALHVARMVTMVTSLTESLIDARARLTNLERWAQAAGFDPATMY
ncbi:hypothetical protein [Rhodospirillum centenum]|uniref:Phage tail fiber protein S, putative n=1 Tax=Rhodospirillum centenum (strain ATCC 51521 / SW) TaxID=414684 RepID=B6IMH3_RHOCS|nr:hypothetical protein [Rhodospirillum centenum]ACI98552.1 phage tail fiber protein S, putative [Rhodospirillum centenum SW]